MACWTLVAGILDTVLCLGQAERVTDLVQRVISHHGVRFLGLCPRGGYRYVPPLYNAVVAGLLLVVRVFDAPLIDGWPEKW